MALRKPLVVNLGRVQQLPDGDGLTVTCTGDGALTLNVSGGGGAPTGLLLQNTDGGQFRVEFGTTSDTGVRPSKGLVIFCAPGSMGWADYEVRPLDFYTSASHGVATLAVRVGTDGRLTVWAATDSTSSADGCLVLTGGAGVAKALNAGGKIRTADTTDSTSTTTGALQSAGGLGVAGNVTVGGWLRGSAGTARLTANATNATTTFSTALSADLSVTLVAGRKYAGRLAVRCSDSTAAEGIKFDFNGGTATMTSFNAGVVANVQGATAGTTVSAALATALNFTAMNGTGDHWIVIEVSMVVNSGGSFIPRFAQNSHSTGTATVGLGSNLVLEDCRN